MPRITTTNDKIEQQWWKLMQGELLLDDDHALRAIIQSLTDYANRQLVDRNGNLIEVQLDVNNPNKALQEIGEDEWARRLAESLALILYGGTVRAPSTLRV